MLDLPSYVYLKPEGVKLQIPSGDSQPSLTFRVSIKHHYLFTLPDRNEEVNTGELTAFCIPTTDAASTAQNPIGVMLYVPSYNDDKLGNRPATYDIRVQVTENRFAELLSLAQRGVLPSDIEITVMDLGGVLPDEHIWDTANRPRLDVTAIDFNVTLVSPRDNDPFYEKVLPAPRVQIDEAIKRLDVIIKLVDTLLSQFGDLGFKFEQIIKGVRAVFWAVVFFGILYVILRIFL